MRIVVFRGDGIGPEIVDACLTVVCELNAALGLGLEICELPIGLRAYADHKSTFPEVSMEAARSADAIILGPLATADYPCLGPGGINASAYLRNHLDLYANIRPSRAVASVRPANPALDVVVVRENIEGFYAVRTMHAGSGEFSPTPDMAFAIRKVSAANSRRIALAAFELARHGGRKRVTAVHKVNVFEQTDGLFLRECRAAAAGFPEIAYAEELVDAVAGKLAQPVAYYEVLLTTNLFGDILSNEAAQLAGGLGLGGTINHGDDRAMAQACHGAAPDIAGKGIANPVSIITSTAMLLEWLARKRVRPDLGSAAQLLASAVSRSLERPESRTCDVGGTASTDVAASAILRCLRQEIEVHA